MAILSSVPPEYEAIVDQAVEEGWLDLEWFAQNTPDNSKLICPTAAEFLTDPRFFTLSPSPKFDTQGYLAIYPDVYAFEFHPLLHYLRFGLPENRLALPEFDGQIFTDHLQGCKVWYETHDLSVTGAPLWLMEVLESNPANKTESVCSSPVYGPLSSAFARICKTTLIHGQSVHRVQNVEEYVKMVDRLAHLMHATGIEIVVANSVMSFVVIDAAFKLGLPTVLIVHEPEPSAIENTLPVFLRSKFVSAFRAADQRIFVSQSSEALWRAQYGIMQNTIINKALPLAGLGDRNRGRKLAECSEQNIILLSVGTISERKGQADFIAALEVLHQHGQTRNFVVVIFGFNDSSYARSLQLRAKRLKEKGLQIFLLPQSNTFGDRARIMDMFAAADIFLMTSRAESLPRTTQEAQASGCAIISTDVEGIGSMVTDGVDGLLYRPGDHETLAKHILSLADDDSYRANIAGMARKNISDDDFTTMTNLFYKLVTDVSTGSDILP